MIIEGQADLVVNTASNSHTLKDSYAIRREALMHKVTYSTNIAAARAMVEAHKAHRAMWVSKLQTLHQSI